MAGDLNNQIFYLAETERHNEGWLPIPGDRPDNGDYLKHICSK